MKWDSTRPAGQRLLELWKDDHARESEYDKETTNAVEHHTKRIERSRGSPFYAVVTRQYMADGHDGFKALVGKPHLIDDEAGQLFSTIVRRYLLGGDFTYSRIDINIFTIIIFRLKIHRGDARSTLFQMSSSWNATAPR